MLIIKDTEQILRMQTDLKLGLPILIRKEEENFLIFSTECISKFNFDLLMSMQGGNPFLCVTARRAETLKARVYDRSISRIRISEDSSLEWVKATADPVLDLQTPLKGPYEVIREGDSHVAKLSIDWCKKVKLIPSSIIKKISHKQVKELFDSYQILSINFLSIEDAKNSRGIRQENANAIIPIKGIKAKVRLFKAPIDNLEHCAIEFGNPSRIKPVLIRIHSECFTGDVLHSQKCDCGSQLNQAIDKFVSEREGILLYLNQEGRGIGLSNKLRAYSLQEQGFDTVDANHRLGFEDDERDFQIAAEILSFLGFSSVRIMTNNPKKIRILENSDIEVLERVSLTTEPTSENISYLRTKAKKSGHLF